MTDATTLRRTGSGMVDDANVCVVETCGVPAPAEAHQLDTRPAMLRNEATLLVAKATELRQRADAIEAVNTEGYSRPFLCEGHRAHIHASVLRTQWGSGRLNLPVGSPEAAAAVETIQSYIDTHQPGYGGACAVCAPGSTFRED